MGEAAARSDRLQWDPSKHRHYSTRCTAFGVPFRSVYGITTVNEELPHEEWLLHPRYLVLRTDDVPPALLWVLKRLGPAQIGSDTYGGERWIPTGMLPLGVALNTLVFWLPVYAASAGAILLGRRVRRALRLRAGRCPRCRYDIGGRRVLVPRVRLARMSCAARSDRSPLPWLWTQSPFGNRI